MQESCDPVVMVRETHILKLAIWPVLLDVGFTGTKELGDSEDSLLYSTPGFTQESNQARGKVCKPETFS